MLLFSATRFILNLTLSSEGRKMSVTSNDRKRLVTELAIFKQHAEEIKERFYKFIVAHDPKGYAYYSISAYPGGYAVPLDMLSLNLSEPASLHFEVMGQDDFPAYMYVPDEYLDDPDGWEARVLEAVAYDRLLAEAAIEAVFGWATASTISFSVERPSGFGGADYITVLLDNETIPNVKWEVFKTLTPLNKARISVSRRNGSVYEGEVPRQTAKPEDADTFMKFIR
jgi:hypothetical protein